MPEEKWALISVFDKSGIIEFARNLVCLGWKILASGGTAKILVENGVQVKDVADLVGGGPILGHRVVTLSREIHAGLLARNNSEDRAELERLGVPFIEMVVCDFYPLSEEIAKPDATIESVIEKTDIGGPTMVRSAAKGGRIVVMDLVDRKTVLEMLAGQGKVDEVFLRQLAAKAEFRVASYCLDSARFHGDYDGIIGRKILDLAYGENRDQSPAALYAVDSNDLLSLSQFRVIAGSPSYISIADGDRALGVMRAMAQAFELNFKTMPHMTVACKHGNPCGIGVSFESKTDSLLGALLGDPIAVMGAEVMTSFEIDEKLGRLLYEVPEELLGIVARSYWGIDVLYAPSVCEATKDLLGRKERRRILVNPALSSIGGYMPNKMIEPVSGGFLVQKSYNYVLDLFNMDWKTDPIASSYWIDAIIAWAAAWRSISNTVALAVDQKLIGLGCGQQDRIACVQLCLDRANRAGHSPINSIFASDGFFPFACRKRQEDLYEGPELLAKAGCYGGIVPFDGKNAEEVCKYFCAQNIKVGFVPAEHRGFFGHG